uniref:Uncharacterized protein n=1 Tax=Arundo donax TaxID=35708 RepID=A0A0A9GYN2_ARUDO
MAEAAAARHHPELTRRP